MGTLEKLVCSECSYKNTIDGSFCRQCGFPLPVEVREEMKAEAEKLLIDGRQLLNDGRTHEASLVADSVLDIDPTNASALALRGDIFERDGQFIEALETYQKVHEIRPDNAMDRIRIAHLEKLVAASEIEVEEPQGSKRGVLLVAAAGVLLTSVGAALYLASLNSTFETDGWVATNTDNVSGFEKLDSPLVPTVPDASRINSPGVGTNPEANPGTSVTNGSVEQVGSNPNPGFRQPVRQDDGMQRPFEPPVSLNDIQIRPSDSGSQPNGSGESSSSNENTARPADEVEEDPGVIEIKTNPSGNNSNNAQASGGAQSAESLIQKARNLYIQENYSGAAEAYEQAIRAGAATGATYQRLAQCYEKLGRRQDAIRNYRNAISSFERQISRGNNSESVRAAKESCERAVSALGG